MDKNTIMQPEEVEKKNSRLTLFFLFCLFSCVSMSQEDTNYNGYLDYEGEDFDSLVCQYDTLVMTNEIELSKIEDGFWCVIGENGHITLSGKFMNGKLINGLEYYYDEYDILLEVREIIPKKL